MCLTVNGQFDSLYEIGLQGIMLVVFIKINIQSKMMNTSTIIPCRCISWRELIIGPLDVNFTFIWQMSQNNFDRQL